MLSVQTVGRGRVDVDKNIVKAMYCSFQVRYFPGDRTRYKINDDDVAVSNQRNRQEIRNMCCRYFKCRNNYESLSNSINLTLFVYKKTMIHVHKPS